MTLNLIAVDTYGSHRVNDPITQKRISAYKIGYSGSTSRVLLALFKDKARDVSSKRASYHYIHINKSVHVKQDFMLLRLTATELQTVETITRSHIHSAVYRWRDGQWWAFPNNREADYHLPSGSHPRFDGTGIGGTQPLVEDDQPSVGVIIVERSQHDPHKPAWFWLSGDTYPHRTFLKSMGCRWSNKRKSWYYVGDKLPDKIQLLVDKLSELLETDNDAPCTDEEAAVVLGVTLEPKPENKSFLPRLFAEGETVYARQELETSDGKVIATGTKGTITRLFNHNTKWGYSYDVTFPDFGTHWFFEDELTATQPTTGISITCRVVVPPGANPSVTNTEIRQAALENGQQAEPIATELETEEMPAIRVIPAPTIPEKGELDDIQRAIRSTKVEPRTTALQTETSRKTLASIKQEYVGDLTGSIAGNVMCYGYAIHEGVLIYLSLGGPRMAVEAMRARLLKGEIVNLTPWDAPAIELTAGEGNTGMFTDFSQNIPEARFQHTILLHEMLLHPNYGAPTTFIIRISDEQARARLKHHVTELVKCAVFDAWTDYLWQAGQHAMLIRPTRSAGGIDMLTLALDANAWLRLITGGLAEKLIVLPEESL